MLTTKLKSLIEEVLWMSAEGKIRKYYMENPKFQVQLDAMMNTFIAIAKTNKNEDKILVWDEENEIFIEYNVTDYAIPGNIGLYNVLNSSDEVYTTSWMKALRQQCGKRMMDMKLSLDERKTVLSPADLGNIYKIIELTAPISWEYKNVNKTSILINQLRYWGKVDQTITPGLVYYVSKEDVVDGKEVPGCRKWLIGDLSEEEIDSGAFSLQRAKSNTKEVFKMVETDGDVYDKAVASAIQYVVKSFDVYSFYDRTEDSMNTSTIIRALAQKCAVEAIIEEDADGADSPIVTK